MRSKSNASEFERRVQKNRSRTKRNREGVKQIRSGSEGKAIAWSKRKKTLLVKVKRDPFGGFTLIFEDSINNCILHEYTPPKKNWSKRELDIMYGIFKSQLKEMIE